MAVRKTLWLLICALALLPVSACCPSPSGKPEPTATAATATPSYASAAPTPSVTPVPTALPEPAPTKTPFSYYAPTVSMCFEELVGDIGYDDLPCGYPSPDTYRVVVDVCHQVVLAYSRNEAGEYTVPERYMLCSTGKDNRTPIGTFSMMAYRVRFSKFVSLGVYGQYWSQIRNRIYFHTILYEKRDASTYIGESYALLGQPQTPGCVYLTSPDARWIYYHIAPDTQIEIRKGSEDDAETAAIRAQLVLAALPVERVSVDNAPYTDNWTIGDVPVEVPFVQGKQN